MSPSPLARRVAALGAVTALLAAGVAGCGSSSGSSTSGASAKTVNPNGPEVSPAGDIPDNQAYVPYRAGDFTVKVPEGWARTTAGGGVTFTDKLNAIQARERTGTGVSAGLRPAGARTSTVTRPAGKAVRITYVTQGRPDPVTGRRRALAIERYVFDHKGRQLVLTLSGAKGADNVDPWKLVSSSVRWTR